MNLLQMRVRTALISATGVLNAIPKLPKIVLGDEIRKRLIVSTNQQICAHFHAFKPDKEKKGSLARLVRACTQAHGLAGEPALGRGQQVQAQQAQVAPGGVMQRPFSLSAYQSCHFSSEKVLPSTSITWWIGSTYFLAKAKSRSSCAGTPITAPSP